MSLIVNTSKAVRLLKKDLPLYHNYIEMVSTLNTKIREEKSAFLILNIETLFRGGICSYWFYRY